MNINNYIDKKNSGALERLEIAMATICTEAGKHLDFERGWAEFRKTTGV